MSSFNTRFIIKNEPLPNDTDIQKYRSAVGTLLCVSENRPDTLFRNWRQNCANSGAMSSLLNLIGYMITAKNIHVCTVTSRSFRCRAEGLITAPTFVEKDGSWLSVATDSDWTGHKETRSSTSCGSMYLGGSGSTHIPEPRRTSLSVLLKLN